MVLYEATYETQDQTDYTLYEKTYIGIGGTVTIRLHNGEVIDLIESGINYHTKCIHGKNLEDIKLGFKPHHIKTTVIGLNQISEIITEGFYINENNRESILSLMKEVKITKIPKRD